MKRVGEKEGEQIVKYFYYGGNLRTAGGIIE